MDSVVKNTNAIEVEEDYGRPKTNFNRLNRTFTPKICSKAHVTKCILRRKQQRLYQSNLQQQNEQENERVERNLDDRLSTVGQNVLLRGFLRVMTCVN